MKKGTIEEYKHFIPCACGGRNCKIGINFDGLWLWFTDKKGKEHSMYLDHNSTTKLIVELKTRKEGQENERKKMENY